MTTLVEHRLALVLGELQDLRQTIHKALGHLPDTGCRWLTPSSLAAEVGVSSRAIQKWVAAGRFPEHVVKKRSRGSKGAYTFLLDREPALQVAERIICGEA